MNCLVHPNGLSTPKSKLLGSFINYILPEDCVWRRVQLTQLIHPGNYSLVVGWGKLTCWHLRLSGEGQWDHCWCHQKKGTLFCCPCFSRERRHLPIQLEMQDAACMGATHIMGCLRLNINSALSLPFWVDFFQVRQNKGIPEFCQHMLYLFHKTSIIEAEVMKSRQKSVIKDCIGVFQARYLICREVKQTQLSQTTYCRGENPAAAAITPPSSFSLHSSQATCCRVCYLLPPLACATKSCPQWQRTGENLAAVIDTVGGKEQEGGLQRGSEAQCRVEKGDTQGWAVCHQSPCC